MPRTPASVQQHKSRLGQFFTTSSAVQAAMVSLVAHRTGTALEPSAGEGHLAAALAAGAPELELDCVELDHQLRWEHELNLHRGDFFTWSSGRDDSFDVIFGNPPYVAWKQVLEPSLAALAVKARYIDKANLYYLFIDRCVDLLRPGGELVFIVPKEWLYTTSAGPLRAKLADDGTITHLIDCGEARLFADAVVPALVIFRFVKGPSGGSVLFSTRLDAATDNRWERRHLTAAGSRWLALDDELSTLTSSWGRLGDIYDVHVGYVTGADRIFHAPDVTRFEPECVQLQVTTRQRVEGYINVNDFETFDAIPPRTAAHLADHREQLIRRRVRRFNDTNWWQYGAARNEEVMRSGRPCAFALGKTRNPAPFFTVADASFFAGGVLGLFQRPGATVTPDQLVAVGNNRRFRRVLEAMFLTTGDKLTLQPATLANAPFPVTAIDIAAVIADD